MQEQQQTMNEEDEQIFQYLHHVDCEVDGRIRDAEEKKEMEQIIDLYRKSND